MKRDYFAAYSLMDAYDSVLRQAIDYLLGAQQPPQELDKLSAVKDPTAKAQLLALAQITSAKSYAQSGDRRTQTGGLQKAIGGLDAHFQEQARNFLKPLGLLPSLPALDALPNLSFALQLTFTLRQPYLSKDESEFYILDNPVRKEKVFRLPYVAPSQWKGSLHSAMVHQLTKWWQAENRKEREIRSKKEDRAKAKKFVAWRVQLFRLFGTEKGVQVDDEVSFKLTERSLENLRSEGIPDAVLRKLEDLKDRWFVGKAEFSRIFKSTIRDIQITDHEPTILKHTVRKGLDTYLDSICGEELALWYRRFIQRYASSNGFHAGRLYFSPTFFTQIGLEIVNPHSRKTGAGELPILFESVPEGASGIFTLLYVPFDLICRDEKSRRAQVAADLQLVVKGLQAMLCVYGFGAKTSSGFGIATETVKGSLMLRATGVEGQKAEAIVGSQPSTPALPRYLETPSRLKPEYLSTEGTFRERSDAELKQMSRVDRQLYEKAKKWWEKEGKQLAKAAAKQPELTEPAPIEQAPQSISWPVWTFNSFEELIKRAEEVANRVKEMQYER